MGASARRCKRVALANGVTIRTSAEVAQVCIANGRATGVVTTDGEEFHAKIVLSNADPKRTYLKLVERRRAAGRRSWPTSRRSRSRRRS